MNTTSVSQGNVGHDYPSLQLYVVYRAGKVAEVTVSSFEAEPTPGAYGYHTLHPNIGLGDSFTSWRHSYPTASCKTSVTSNEPGTPDSDNVFCLVVGIRGNFTSFTFTALEPKTPKLEGIGIAVKSLLATTQAAGAH